MEEIVDGFINYMIVCTNLDYRTHHYEDEIKLGAKTYFSEPYHKCIQEIKNSIKTQNLIIALENYGVNGSNYSYEDYKVLIALFILEQAVENALATKEKKKKLLAKK